MVLCMTAPLFCTVPVIEFFVNSQVMTVLIRPTIQRRDMSTPANWAALRGQYQCQIPSEHTVPTYVIFADPSAADTTGGFFANEAGIGVSSTVTGSSAVSRFCWAFA